MKWVCQSKGVVTTGCGINDSGCNDESVHKITKVSSKFFQLIIITILQGDFHFSKIPRTNKTFNYARSLANQWLSMHKLHNMNTLGLGCDKRRKFTLQNSQKKKQLKAKNTINQHNIGYCSITLIRRKLKKLLLGHTTPICQQTDFIWAQFADK